MTRLGPTRSPPNRLRLRATAVAETDLHATVVRALDLLLRPGACWTTPARLGLKRGWPDILIVSAGHAYGIELDRDGAALSRTRRATLARLQGAGMQIAVCRSLEDALATLDNWNVPRRGLR